LEIIRIFSNSFFGSTLFYNPFYKTPTQSRISLKLQKSQKYKQRIQDKISREEYSLNHQLVSNPLDSIFKTTTSKRKNKNKKRRMRK